MRKLVFCLFLLAFVVIPLNPVSAWPPATDPTTYCYPWQGNRYFCNWWGFSDSLGRGPYWYSNDDYIANMAMTFGGTVYHVSITIEAVYENIGGNWLVKDICRDSAPAHFNDNGDWQLDYNVDDPYFDNCDKCYGASNNRLKSFYYCFPASGAVTVSIVPNTGTPSWVATTMQAWLNNENNMYRPSNSPAADFNAPWNDSHGSRVVYSKRYSPTYCN